MDRSKLKQTALLLLRGNWEWAVILSLLTAIIGGLIAGATGGIGSIIAGLITAGYAFAFLDLVAGKKETNYFSAMFSAFTTTPSVSNVVITNHLCFTMDDLADCARHY